ncbi:DNA/RNA non-specific endonuclease [Rubellicoccus peritrichatus]|uniref:DNA/RNA non-specific endonuclease n=1 Tax=Rubellicoccus peritrichatus TaxID=3080537 RepID=A0AAQ3QVH4_9BACT|nr:DNA/RNA non-specific endonuclease [Puniceicoccus sp. CR14]WOO43426.1 DNA/RNA non-specific endonuclease [Puniceicoccus sp. CR14]
MARKRPRKKTSRKKSSSSNKGCLFVLGLIVVIGAGAWVFSLPKHERQDAVIWLLDVYDWGEKGFKGPLPERIVRFQVDDIPPGQYTFGGVPLSDEEFRLLPKNGFLVAYDEDRKNPAWVAYKIEGKARYPSYERPESFSPDKQTVSRIEHEDYTGSGYDRGHMAPNSVIATRYGKEAQEDTFLMSNIVPQAPHLNQGLWRELEGKVANKYSRHFDTIYVITGPIYDNETERLKSGVEIPDSFFKIILGKNKNGVTALAVVMGQGIGQRTSLSNTIVSIQNIEMLTGFDFFHELPDDQENRLETIQRSREW